MTKTTDGLEFDEAQIERLVQLVRDIINAQADSGEEAFTIAFGVFARYTCEIKPEYREQMLTRIEEALRVFWKAQDDRARESVM